MDNKPMTKAEFMSRYINDQYKKKYEERKKEIDANAHTFGNMDKIKKRKRSFKNVKSR